MSVRNPFAIAMLVIVIIIIAGVGVYYFLPQLTKKNSQSTQNTNTAGTNTNQASQQNVDFSALVQQALKDIGKPPAASASAFAAYTPVPVNITPKVAAYTVAADLSNVTNKSDFVSTNADTNVEAFKGSKAMQDLLVKNAFVVTPNFQAEFYPLYESNRYGYTPSFVTTDSMLHNYHLFFDYLLKTVETDHLNADLTTLTNSMLSASQDQYTSLKGTAWENAAKRNVGFFAVATKLLDSKATVPALVKDEVNQELAYIDKHDGIHNSPVMNIGEDTSTTLPTNQGDLSVGALLEDYSQYVPRGHYDKTDLLKAYFKTMMWYGRLTFRLKSDDEVRSAMLVTVLLNDKDNQKSWEAIYEPTNFFVGKSDDITYYQFRDVIKDVYGVNATATTLTKDASKFSSFTAKAQALEPPQINSIPVFNPAIQPDREKEIKGFRFMGQRFTIDASVFQRLICREVGNKHGTMDCPTEDSRMLPKGLDITAAMGSNEAVKILTSEGDMAYKNYPENLAKMQAYLSSLGTNVWTQNIYWGWVYSLKPLTGTVANGYPSFMTNEAWARKDLNTYLGSWTELKHDTILYAKQVYAELGGGPPDVKDDRGYVEPRPEVFASLAALSKMTREGLELRGLVSGTVDDDLKKMEELATSLKTISEKELANQQLTNDEYDIIRTYGGQLEHFWLDVNKEEMAATGVDQRNYLDQNPAALVADVATDPNGQVLEEGTGHIDDIYVVVPVDGKLRIAKGGVYSYYEFPQPLADRLTDAKWREMVNDYNNPPKRPEWTSSFITQ